MLRNTYPAIIAPYYIQTSAFKAQLRPCTQVGDLSYEERGIMRFTKRRGLLAALLLTVAIMLLMAGCASSESSSSAAASEKSASTETSAAAESAEVSANASELAIEQEAASSSSADTAAFSGESIPALKLKQSQLGGFNPVNNFTEPKEMSAAEVEKAERAIRAYTPPTQESLIKNNAKTFYYRNQLKDQPALLYEAIGALLEDPTTDEYMVAVTVGKAEEEQLAKDYFKAVFSYQYDHPECFWMYNDLEVTVEAGYDPTEGKLYIALDKPYKKYEKEMTAFNDAVDGILNDIDPNASDAEKALAIHDKLLEMVKYDYEIGAPDNMSNDLAHTAYGALVVNGNGDANTAVCDGISLAYEYLLQQVGIEAAVIVGEAGNTAEDAGPHAWNIVKLDGEWYEVDLTWNIGQYEWRAELDKYKVDNPNDELVPLLEEALYDEAFFDLITHYLYNVTTAAITDYVPGDEYVYVYPDGRGFAPLEKSVHIRASELDDYEIFDEIIMTAPTATGTQYAHK